MNPNDIRYTESHEWARLEGDVIVIGITEYAAKEVGDIVFIEFEEEDEIAKGETFGILETVKAVFDLHAPVSGDIAEVNREAEENPDLIKEDPLGKGWLIKVTFSDEEELDDLMTTDAYDKFCRDQE